MSSVRRTRFAAVIALAVLLPMAKLMAEDAPATKYTQAGKVLAAIDKHGHFYQVATDDKVYLLMCTKVRGFQIGMPECKLGEKGIAAGDTVNFRIEDDWAYMPAISGESEQKLRILTTEMKVTPPAPAAATPAQAPAPKDSKSLSVETAVVIGTGMHVKGQHGLGWSATPRPVSGPIVAASGTTPVMPTGPVLATPTTGGAPVSVIATAPTTGGMVTGVPVTGGAPITAIATGPVMGMPVGGAPGAGGMMIGGGGGAPVWVHVLRIRTAGKTYQVECSKKPCSVAGKDVALGDTLTLRTDNKKHAYLSSSGDASGATGQEFKILEVTYDDSPASSKPQ